MFLRRVIAENFSKIKYGLPDQWVKAVSLQEGMEQERTTLYLGKSKWLGNREKDSGGEEQMRS